MDFQQAIKVCFQKYADFKGRAARPEFWWFYLFQVIVLLVTGWLYYALYVIAALGLLLPGLAAGARRLHDIGKSGWWMLVGLVPILGWLLLIYWAAQPGELGPNAYGPQVDEAEPSQS